MAKKTLVGAFRARERNVHRCREQASARNGPKKEKRSLMGKVHARAALSSQSVNQGFSHPGEEGEEGDAVQHEGGYYQVVRGEGWWF